MSYNKHFIPLESNPEVFNQLIHQLGVSDDLRFHDVWSLSEPELLAFIPRPVLALVIVFPIPPQYEDRLAEENKLTPEYTKTGEDEDVMWFKQTINNACGLYGILHAVANGSARDFIKPKSHLFNLLGRCTSLSPSSRATVLENDKELESKYHSVAILGDTEAPQNAESEVDFHYVCFVKSHRNGNLYIMDGDKNGPINRGPMSNDDLLSEQGIEAVMEFIRQHDDSGQYSLLALAPNPHI
ncbi:putative ubiquitin carboxyl-terminal hydrolase isozyme l3 protein [Ilyonectria robusta]